MHIGNMHPNSRRLVPPTNLLVAFLAVSRSLSVSRAAEELNLTQSAVSRQVQQLEDLLGVKLFERVKKRLVATNVGRSYAAELHPALERIRAATLKTAIRSDGNILNFAILPTFGSRWLIPRLPAFQRAYPNYTIHLSTTLEVFDFETQEFDAAIHFGRPDWPGAQLDLLMGEVVIPVCSADYAEQAGLRTKADLSGCTLLQIITQRDPWADFFAQFGLPRQQMRLGPSFQLYSMMIQAAIQGMGVALIPDFLVQGELDAGLLVAPLPMSMRIDANYYLAYPEHSRALPAFRSFRLWLLEEARRQTGAPAMTA